MKSYSSVVFRVGRSTAHSVVREHDVVTIYMPQIPELVFAMLACAKMGAAHSVVYGGFSVEALAERIAVAGSRVLVTADGGWRRGKVSDLKGIVDEAIKRSPTIETCVVVKRTGHEVYMESGRDFWYHELMQLPISCDNCGTEVMDAEDPLFILYTSPTAVRGLMRFGSQWPRRYDTSSLRLLGSVGEPINPEAWRWYHEVIGEGRCPIMDTWWQTETGGFMITPLPVTPLKPGSATKPFFGNEVAVVDDEGNAVEAGEEGKLVIKNPWPGMARTIYGDADRYVETYWKGYEKQGWYTAGDSARIDEDGYIWIIGRIDDVIKVSGYRLGTAEIESALVSHNDVAEAAAIGLPHKLKGNAIHAYVILRAGVQGTPELAEQLCDHVRHEIGPIAKPERVVFVDALPKTRSGKIMRRVLIARALGKDEGDLSTLEE